MISPKEGRSAGSAQVPSISDAMMGAKLGGSGSRALAHPTAPTTWVAACGWIPVRHDEAYSGCCQTRLAAFLHTVSKASKPHPSTGGSSCIACSWLRVCRGRNIKRGRRSHAGLSMAQTGHAKWMACLHGRLVLPGLLPREQLPQDHAEAVHIALLIVALQAHAPSRHCSAPTPFASVGFGTPDTQHTGLALPCTHPCSTLGLAPCCVSMQSRCLGGALCLAVQAMATHPLAAWAPGARLAAQHLGRGPLRRAGLALPRQPRAAAHARQPKVAHLCGTESCHRVPITLH